MPGVLPPISHAHSPIQAILTSAHQVQRVEAALAGRGKILGLVGEERLGVEGKLYHGHGETRCSHTASGQAI
jgi:hypothetical protein